MPFVSSQSQGRQPGFANNRYDTAKVKKQIENAETRIRSAGYVKEDTDKRNIVEKALNLPQGQNAFFDVLEILGRPGSAVMNAIDKGMEGENVAAAAWRGLSGQDRVNGADLAEKMGVENKAGKFLLGTALDIGLDPTTYIPGGVLAKGIKQGAALAAKPVKAAYGALENASPALKNFRTDTLQPALEGIKDTVGYGVGRDYKLDETLTGAKDDTILQAKQQAENRIGFMTEESMRGISDAAKLAGGVDTGTNVGRILEKDLKQFEDVKGYEFPDGVTRTGNRGDLLDAVKANREKIKNLSKELGSNNKEYQSTIGEFADALTKTENQIRKIYMGLERQAGKELDQATRQNLREAGRELARMESQLANFGQNEASLLRYYRKQVRDAHNMRFGIVKRVKETAPNGIRWVEGAEIPASLKNFIRANGKGLDEVADELGYDNANDLLSDLQSLSGGSRKLDNATVDQLAREQMEQTGALKSLADTKTEMEKAVQSLRQSIKEIEKTSSGTNVTKATEQAFKSLSVDDQYQELARQRDAIRSQLDALKGESKQTKQGYIDQIRQVEDEIDALKKAAKNPIIIQKELARPAREYSNDPGIQQAAKTLMSSNAEIRGWANANGVGIAELEGYMTHILAAEERKRRRNLVNVDKGNTGTGQPKKAILNERQYKGSVEDINEKAERTIFEPNAYFATAIGQKRLIEYVNAVNFRRQVLTNENFARKLADGEKVGELPKNQVVIDSNNYKFLKESGDVLEGAEIGDEIGGKYIVTKAVKNALDRYQKLTTDEGINGFLTAFDKMQSIWKRAALFSIPYHIRNDVGAKFNNWVGGMNVPSLIKYSAIADKEVFDAVINGVESEAYREFRKQGLGNSSLAQIEFARRGEDPEEAIRRTIENRSKTTGQKVAQRINPINAFQTSQEFGSFIDSTNRFALFKWALDKGMTPEQAAKKVREVQFDYSNLTALEREVFSRIAPFYRWMRNNIPFQIKQFIQDPRKYANINKVRENAQEAVGIDDENVPDWMKESFALPVAGEDGSGKFLGLNLPVGDLTKLSNPLKMLIDSVTPLAKLPAEVALNRNFFYNKPIEQFEGQEKQFQIPGTNMDFGIDSTLAYVIEQLSGQMGRGLSGYLQKPEDADQDTKFRTPSMGISSILKDFDAEKAQYFQQVEELRKLQDLIKYIEQQSGQEVKTINEIEKARR